MSVPRPMPSACTPIKLISLPNSQRASYSRKAAQEAHAEEIGVEESFLHHQRLDVVERNRAEPHIIELDPQSLGGAVRRLHGDVELVAAVDEAKRAGVLVAQDHERGAGVDHDVEVAAVDL